MKSFQVSFSTTEAFLRRDASKSQERGNCNWVGLWYNFAGSNPFYQCKCKWNFTFNVLRREIMTEISEMHALFTRFQEKAARVLFPLLRCWFALFCAWKGVRLRDRTLISMVLRSFMKIVGIGPYFRDRKGNRTLNPCTLLRPMIAVLTASFV